MRPSAILLAAASTLPLGGCCALARGLCGPDTTPWVSVDFQSPEATARTFLEALRRDDPEVVYACLARDCRQELGVDGVAAQLAWPQIRTQHPYLHVAGYAAVPPATRLGPDAARLRIAVEGAEIEVDLVRQTKWEVRYRRADGALYEPGALVADLAAQIALAPANGDERSTITLQPLRFRHDGLDAVPLDAIEFAGVVREWRVRRWREATRP
ncbi:MAG: hypothetical protein FJ301_10655 [Planctomycetes bacterium]|nr:hypothetical protein [Planctomycetota bacterium]